MANMSLTLTDFAGITIYRTALLALFLDLLLADSPYLPQVMKPVRKLCALLDRSVNRPLLLANQRLARGLLLAVMLPVCLTFALQGALQVLYNLHPYLYYIIRLLLVWQLISFRGPLIRAENIAHALRHDGPGLAREELAQAVGRREVPQSGSELIQKTVDYLLENFITAIVAPLFYYMLFDLQGMFFYKVIHTLENMIGRQNARYEDFGKPALFLSQILHFLPSRLAAFFLALAGFLTRLDGKQAFLALLGGPHQDTSYLGQTKAVVAGTLGIQPEGNSGRRPDIADIDKMVRLLYLGVAITYVSFFALRRLFF